MSINKELLEQIKNNIFADQKLELIDQDILDADVHALTDALKSNTYIKKLDLSHNKISNEGAKLLAKNLVDIQEINVSVNNIGSEGCIALSNTKFKKIDISGNLIGDAVSAFTSSASLIELSAFECGITDLGAAALFSSQCIMKLDLGNNTISGSCFKNIMNNKMLKELNLMQNSIVEENCSYVAKNKTLTHLDLTNTFLGDKAAKLLAQNASLECLTMNYCLLGNEGAIALSTSATLKILLLTNNRIKDQGAMALANNNTLLQLNLKGNSISNSVVALLKSKYLEDSQYLVFNRKPGHIQELSKKKSNQDIHLKANKESMESFLEHTAITSSHIFTPQHQSTPAPKKPEEILAKELLAMSSFQEFFRTADPKQIEIFWGIIKEDKAEFNKKQKLSHPSGSSIK